MNTLTIRRGDSRVLDLTAITAAGTPYLLTGVALTFTVKRGFEDADTDALIEKTIGSGIEVTNAAGGIAEISLTSADTAALRPGAWLVWDVQAVENDEVVTLATGSMRVLPDVTVTVS